MPASEEQYGEIFDQLFADGYMLRAFMLQVSVELAKATPNPQEWATGFISSLHGRIDTNESAIGDAVRSFPSHEMARKGFDRLGKDLIELLRPHSQ